MNKLNKLFLAVMLGVTALSLSAGTFAVEKTKDCPPTGPGKEDILYDDSFGEPGCPINTAGGFFDVLERIFTVGASIVGIIAALFILVAAFTYITSHGDEEKIGKAKNTIIYAVIGIVIAALAYGVPIVIKALLGL